ncbi:MAG: YCF48-related protein [Syntrophales bacterium]
MRRLLLLSLVAACLGVAACGTDSSPEHQRTGWVIGAATDAATGVPIAKILKSGDGGTTWSLQTGPAVFAGMRGNDISAVSADVAWAALGTDNEQEGGGAIAHTADGGATWRMQALPPGMVSGHIKGIKGISATEAWAVSLRGDVLHTVDAGTTWTVVPVRRLDGQIISMGQVNRMDVTGNDIWIVDIAGLSQGVIHSADRGVTWRREQLPRLLTGSGPLAVSAHSSQTAWVAVHSEGTLWWTDTGGALWNKSSGSIAGTGDFDDICASSAHTVWVALNNGMGGGLTAKIVVAGGAFSAVEFKDINYNFEGISTLDDHTAWLVGMKTGIAPPQLPSGVIYTTRDGGVTWRQETVPDNARDVAFWKVSFVGARR